MISAVGGPEIFTLFFLAGLISITVIIITQVRKNMTPKDKKGELKVLVALRTVSVMSEVTMNDHGLDIARAAFEKFEREAQWRGVSIGQAVCEGLAS